MFHFLLAATSINQPQKKKRCYASQPATDIIHDWSARVREVTNWFGDELKVTRLNMFRICSVKWTEFFSSLLQKNRWPPTINDRSSRYKHHLNKYTQKFLIVKWGLVLAMTKILNWEEIISFHRHLYFRGWFYIEIQRQWPLSIDPCPQSSRTRYFLPCND